MTTTTRPLPRMPFHDLTGKRIPPATAVKARELEIGEELRRLTFLLSREKVTAPKEPA